MPKHLPAGRGDAGVACVRCPPTTFGPAVARAPPLGQWEIAYQKPLPRMQRLHFKSPEIPPTRLHQHTTLPRRLPIKWRRHGTLHARSLRLRDILDSESLPACPTAGLGHVIEGRGRGTTHSQDSKSLPNCWTGARARRTAVAVLGCRRCV